MRFVCLSLFECSGAHRDLHSFPTRRSSDLEGQAAAILAVAQATAEGIRKVADTIRMPGGFEAVQLRVAEQYIGDRKSTRLNSSHRCISYAVFCLKKKKQKLPGTLLNLGSNR